MKAFDTLTLPQILKLFEKNLGLVISRPSLYHYMNKCNFPKPIAINGSTCRPSRWRKPPVHAWFKKQTKKSTG